MGLGSTNGLCTASPSLAALMTRGLQAEDEQWAAPHLWASVVLGALARCHLRALGVVTPI